jgi:hypothetical protein
VDELTPWRRHAKCGRQADAPERGKHPTVEKVASDSVAKPMKIANCHLDKVILGQFETASSHLNARAPDKRLRQYLSLKGTSTPR